MPDRIRNLFLVSLLFFGGCDIHNPFNLPIASKYSIINTPLNVVYTLKQAYMSKDLPLYLSCLHRDSFRFYFNSQDTVVRHILELDLGIDSMVWGYDEEKLATEALFELSNSIYLEYLNSSHFFSQDSSVFYFIAGYYMVIGEENGASEIAQGRLIFTLKKSEDKWFVFRWDDYPM